MPSGTEGKTITCRAAVCWEPKTQLVMETVEVAPPKREEVRIKMVATGVCHSDLTVAAGGMGGAFPCILGHEGAGIVESIGEGVTSVQPGDHVIPLFTPRCRECKFCKHPSGSNACNAIDTLAGTGVLIDGTSRFKCKGKTIYHCFGTSTFSEYTVVPEVCVAKIDSRAPLEKVCLIGCGVSTGYGSALNTANVRPDSNVAIWGLGSIGLAVALGCRERGAKRIIGIDINASKFELARKFGCTEFVNPKEYDRPIQDVLSEMTDGGLDYTFECIGNVDTMRAALEATHKGWGVAVVIGVAPAGKVVSTEPMQLVFGRTWKGSLYGDWKGRDDVPKLVQKYMEGKLVLDDFISHNFTFEKLNHAFDLLHRGEALRSVITF